MDHGPSFPGVTDITLGVKHRRPVLSRLGLALFIWWCTPSLDRGWFGILCREGYDRWFARTLHDTLWVGTLAVGVVDHWRDSVSKERKRLYGQTETTIQLYEDGRFTMCSPYAERKWRPPAAPPAGAAGPPLFCLTASIPASRLDIAAAGLVGFYIPRWVVSTQQSCRYTESLDEAFKGEPEPAVSGIMATAIPCWHPLVPQH